MSRNAQWMAAALATVAGCAAALAAPGDIERISVSSSGVQGDADCDQGFPHCTPDGRFVTFASMASNLVPGGTLHDIPQVFLRDRLTNTTTCVSLAADGSEPTGGLTYANSSTITADGRYVAFDTDGDFNGVADGDFLSDVYLKDTVTGAMTRISVGVGGVAPDHVGGSYFAWISDDGNFIAYETDATNLSTTPDTNGLQDVYRWSRATNTTTIVSVTSTGVQGDGDATGCTINADGRYVAFDSTSTNQGSSNADGEAYRKDMTTGALIVCSVRSDGTQNQGNQTLVRQISADGNTVAFLCNDEMLTSDSGNGGIRDVYVRRVAEAQTLLCDKSDDGVTANANTGSISLSRDGNVVCFRSIADNLVPGDGNFVEDVFAYNISLGKMQRCSTSASGGESDGINNRITGTNADGTIVIFYSDATNLVPDDTNGWSDFFVKQIAWVNPCEADLNGDGSIDQGDVDCMIAAAAGDSTCLRTDIPINTDLNQDGNVDQGDVDTEINVVAGGPCV